MSPLRIAVLGHGNVGATLAGAFLAAGHDVTLGADADRLPRAEQARAARPTLARASVAAAHEAVADADLVVLAVPFRALDELLPPLRDALDGTTVVDATNPVGPGLTHGLGPTSGAQHVAALAPGAHVVKAFNVYGVENLGAAPTFPDVRPFMPYAGDDEAAKHRVAGLLADLGWDPLDVGPLAAALDIEHLSLLWIRMVRAGGHDPHLVWAALRGTP